MGRLKTKRSKTKGKKEDEKVKKNRTKKDKKKVDWGNNGDKEVRIKHSSHTQIKVFFKKKK